MQKSSDAHKKKGKDKREIVKSVIPKKMFDDDGRNFIADALRHADRGNELMRRQEGADLLQEMKPNLNRTLDSRIMTRDILKNIYHE